MRAGMKLVVWLCLALAGTAWGQVSVPAPLEPWRDWVMKDQAFRDCPLRAGGAGESANDYLCAWPGPLRIDADATGAGFVLRWQLDAPAFVPLPGDAAHWPQEVQVNGRPAPVAARDERPMLWLETGSVEVRGRIPWRQRPQVLSVPSRIGQIELRVDGRVIAPLRRVGEALTLGRAAGVADQADALDVRVYRQLADGLPAMLETRLMLAGSGQVREVVLGPVLPAGFVPVSLAGDWPARIEADGRLRLQVRPEATRLVLLARADAPLAGVQVPSADAPWPRQEVWSWQPAPAIRMAQAQGPRQVDPGQAGVPAEWHGLPAFALAAGERLVVEERSRGRSPDEGNRLTLEREGWLDHDGGGWYLRDRISGQMRRDWRLEVAPPLRLLRAASLIDGESPLLVTQLDQADAAAGVQWHHARVALAAGLRNDAPTRLPAAGWRQDFDRVAATLRVPEGYRLIAAPGADVAHGSWVAGWTLLDVFVVAVVALLAWHALGMAGTAMVLGYLLLAYHEPAAPVWSLGVVLALLLVARALPEGRLQGFARLLRGVFMVSVLLLAVPFAANQLRMALHPQLESELSAAADDWSGIDSVQFAHAPAPRPSAPPMQEAAELRARVAGEEALQRLTVSGTRADLADWLRDSVVQTGPGEPSWQRGRSYRLEWGGPVLAGQEVRLWLSPPWLTRTLRVAAVALLALVLLRVLRDSGVRPRWRAAPAATGVVFAALFAGLPAPAQAQAFPPQEMLDQLRERLAAAPRCAPACANVAEARVQADGDWLSLQLEVHAQARVAVPLPQDEAALELRAVLVDGAPAVGLLRRDGQLQVPVERGVRRIQMQFRSLAERAALTFALRPQRVLFGGEGWQASGLGEDRLLAETLTLTRVRAETAGETLAAQQFPPYVRVVRRLQLGLEWTLDTRVQRIAPASGGFSARIPVLPGERVLTPGREVRDGRIEVAIADREVMGGWRSRLDPRETLALTAPALAEHAEEWRVVLAPIWQARFDGVPESLVAGDEAGLHEFVFHPLPGETLTVSLSRPQAAAGATRAIDAVQLHSEAGQRAGEHRLTLTLRASQGGEHAIALPADATVLAVSRNGETLNLRPVDGRLTLPLQPGSQRFEIRLRTGDELGLRQRLPALALGLPAANIDLTLQLPQDRWVWFAHGPRTGPAVLYWGELAVLLLVAFALARSGYTRLGLGHWLLLGIGFSTFSWAALLLVVGWLFALAWRGRQAPERLGAWFNPVQVGLVLLTLVAFSALFQVIPHGLLGLPDMHVVGNGSSAHHLQWFADRSMDALPEAGVVSLPLWVYRAAMLAWALWLANAVIGWSREAFRAWTQGGYWRSRERKRIEETKGNG